jgi:hypothetical protein
MSSLALIIAIIVAMISPSLQTPPSVVGASTFVSLEGRFSISLPDRHGFSGLTVPTPAGTAKGDMYQWFTKEAGFGVGYADAAQSLDDPDAAKQFFNGATDVFKKLVAANSGNVAGVKQITLDKYPGIEQRADLFTGAIIQRTYIASRRIYELVAVMKNTQRVYESVAVGVLDSFKILSEAEVANRSKQEAAKAEPSPLPQTPVAERAGSDASDEGLRGRVKSVLTESQDLSGTWSIQTRKRNSLESYNEKGNITREERYDYKGNLSEVTVYGYIDGRRVSASKMVEHEYNPPPMRIEPAPGAAVKTSDNRYGWRYEFKYDDQKRLTEKTYFQSNGDVWLRYVYKYTGKQQEELVYAEDGSLNQRYLLIFDDKGNTVEKTSFDTRTGAVEWRQSYTYEFDSHGNWTRRTASKIVTKDGRELREPSSVYYRTITYY